MKALMKTLFMIGVVAIYWWQVDSKTGLVVAGMFVVILLGGWHNGHWDAQYLASLFGGRRTR